MKLKHFLVFFLVSATAEAFEISSGGVVLSKPSHEILIINRGSHSLEETGESLDPVVSDEHTLTYGIHDPILFGMFVNFGPFTVHLATAIESGRNATKTHETRGGYASKNFGAIFGAAHQSNFKIIKGTVADELQSHEKRNQGMAYQGYTAQFYGVLLDLGLDLSKTLELADYPKSYGSGLMGIITLDHVNIDASGPVIPENQRRYFRRDSGFSKGEFSSLNISLGWAHTHTFDEIYLSGLIAFGAGKSQLKYKNDAKTVKKSKNTFREHFVIGGGYTTDLYFIGGEYNIEAPEYQLQTITLQTVRHEIKVASGMKW